MHRSFKRLTGLISVACAASATALIAVPVTAQADLVSLGKCDNGNPVPALHPVG